MATHDVTLNTRSLDTTLTARMNTAWELDIDPAYVSAGAGNGQLWFNYAARGMRCYNPDYANAETVRARGLGHAPLLLCGG